MVVKRYLVTGRVQGVFFRASTARVARRLELTGYAKNLADGRVEVLACGMAHAVAELEAWLWQGPSASSVTDVGGETLTIDPPADFLTA